MGSELERVQRTSAEWMRNSCSPAQYESVRKEKEAMVKEVDELKGRIDALREAKLEERAKVKEMEGELGRVKGRYRDLYAYTEQQKGRLAEYRQAMTEMKGYRSVESKASGEAERYFRENVELKERLRVVQQEMGCVQNACMNLMKRQVLMNHQMLSQKPMKAQTGGKREDARQFMRATQPAKPGAFAFRK